MYAVMLERLDYQQDDTPESLRIPANQVRAQFDNELRVPLWRMDRDSEVIEDTRPEGAPAWWDSDEEASNSFLSSMGVNL